MNFFKKQLLIRLHFVISIFFISSPLFSQVDSMMKMYAEQLPQQKIYTQFDKSIYRAGETIWFKAYLLEGYQLTADSKNLFTELIDNNGNVLQRKIYPLLESSAAGYFDIPENAGASQLTFRAYTTWMLNFDSAFIFQRNIDVVNKIGSTALVAKDTLAAITNLHFFPEGGDLVNTLESFVAFKANDGHGLPVYVSGTIRNSKGEVIDSFKVAHDGMGMFKLIPVSGETYTAYWKDGKGDEHTTLLPGAKSEGVVLSLANIAKNKIYILKRSAGALQSNQNLYVEAHMAGRLVYKAKVSMVNNPVNSGNINTEKFPAGVMQVTVFSDNWEPLAERIVMVNNNNYQFDVNLKADTTNFNIRAKNVFEITLGDTVLSNLSIAVTDADIATKENTDNIISGLLLTGDIKGYIHEPAYYFSNTSDSVSEHLDLVLLTHGWRRYNWADISNKKMPRLKFPSDSYLSLNAKVFGISPSSPLRSDEKLVAIVTGKDSSNQIMEIPKTGATTFSVSNLIFFDTVSVHYQFAKDRKMEKMATVVFDNGLYKGLKKVNPLGLPYSFFGYKDQAAINRTKYLSEQIIKYTDTWAGKGNVLQSVTVRTRPKSRADVLDEQYASGFFKGGDALSFDMVNEHAIDIFTYLRGRVAGLNIREAEGEQTISWRGSSTAIFIDEIQSDVDQLSAINVNDIAFIKVFRPPFFGSSGGGAGGAIAIYTRKGGDVQYTPGKGLLSSQIVGYSFNKEFYSPDYTTRSSSTDVAADYRSTLYWNPYIFLDGSKQSLKIRFFNNDITKAYRVILEGVNEFGKLVRIEKLIQ